MSAASRDEKRRRQEAANQRLAAAGIQVPQKAPATANRTPLIVGGVIVAVIVIAGAWVLFNRTANTEPTYTATASGAVVTAGNGPVVVDVYEDYLCPNCERLEQRDGNAITNALNSGQITVKYHNIAILDAATTPAGYSTRAADAALCAVPAGIFPKFHKKLFEVQPAERSAGLTDDQLIAYGTELGATGDFAACVRGTGNDGAVKTETANAIKAPALQVNGQFGGTPAIVVGSTRIDVNDTNWLTKATAAK